MICSLRCKSRELLKLNVIRLQNNEEDERIVFKNNYFLCSFWKENTGDTYNSTSDNFIIVQILEQQFEMSSENCEQYTTLSTKTEYTKYKNSVPSFEYQNRLP